MKQNILLHRLTRHIWFPPEAGRRELNKITLILIMKYKRYITITNIGLTLNIIGTLLVAYAFGALPFFEGYAWYKNPITGSISNYRDAYFIHPKGFYIGIALLVIGFFLQLKPKLK
jgi:hypothetical protein